MRRALVLLTVAALAAGAAEAVFGSGPVLLRTPGAELVELQNGNGRAAVTGKGALLLNVGRGRVRIVDRRGGGRPRLSPACRRRAERVSATTVQIAGRNIGCFVSSQDGGGPWQIIMRGRRISASGSVRGSLTLDAVDVGPTGVYRIASQSWREWPRSVDTYVLNRR